MINSILDSLYNFALSAIDKLPDIDTFSVPAVVYTGIDNILSFVAWLMPYNLYIPLITFILSLTAFRIVYAVYLHFKR